jgi:hypothetical protein
MPCVCSAVRLIDLLGLKNLNNCRNTQDLVAPALLHASAPKAKHLASFQHLLLHGVSAAVADPGTTEMWMVSALEKQRGIRCILGLQEAVCTGEQRTLLLCSI